MRVDLTLFDVGQCRHCERVTLAGGRWGKVTFPSMVALIVHPTEGAILYDTGYAPHFMDATAGFPERLYQISDFIHSWSLLALECKDRDWSHMAGALDSKNRRAAHGLLCIVILSPVRIYGCTYTTYARLMLCITGTYV